jgi:hypothetical protein
MKILEVSAKDFDGEWGVLLVIEGKGDFVLTLDRADMLGDLLKHAARRADKETRDRRHAEAQR